MMATAQFRISKVVVEQFAILGDELPNDVSSIIISWAATYGAVPEDHLLACKMRCVYSYNGVPLLILEISLYYEIHPDSWQTFIQDGKIIIPAGFQPMMMSHTVGTARGILFCKTEGTPFNTLILPPVNVEELVNGDFAITV